MWQFEYEERRIVNGEWEDKVGAEMKVFLLRIMPRETRAMVYGTSSTDVSGSLGIEPGVIVPFHLVRHPEAVRGVQSAVVNGRFRL